ncbi:MAG: caspase family protein [Cyanobacteria bacterium J06592_8]
MYFKRRHFLQFTGSALTVLGINSLNLKQQGDRYAQVLAQPTSRKLALLVGINQYPNSDRSLNLNGPITDVALQKELLIHRFGFNRDDILTLTDETQQKPTRTNILEAFETHLIQQAKPGDVVVFHFSGHGSRVLDPKPINNNDLNSTFVPSDASNDIEFVPDIMGRTLFLLMSALQTENVTVVLDCCYSGGGTRGNIRVRSARGGYKFKPNQTELDYQEQWLNQLFFDPEKFHKLRSIGVAKGVVIASAQRHQESADMEFEGFHAGAFTYLLTQYLWQETQSANNAIVTLTPSVKYLAKQTPFIDLPIQRSRGVEPMFFLDKPGLAAEGIILQKGQGNQATVWLGGIERENLQEGIKLTFDVVSPNGDKIGSAQVLSGEGLTRTATIQGTVEKGMLLRETARTIPRDLQLRIGLDPSLGNDTAEAQQLLQSLQRVEPILYQSSEHLYDGSIDYILSVMTDEYRQQFSSQDLPKIGSIGLLSQEISEVIPSSFSQPGETIESAINRLNAKFKSLLTARILKQTLNAKSSQLNVAASLVLPKKGNQILAETFTVRGSSNQLGTEQRRVPILPVNQPFQIQVKNLGNDPLYISVLSVDYGGEVVVLFPPGPIPEAETQVSPQQTLLVPDPDKDQYEAKTDEPGFAEILILASRQPMKQSLKALQTLAEEQRLQERTPVGATDEAIANLLDDLSSDRSESSTTGNERTILTSEIAGFSITIEVTCTIEVT